MNIKDIAQFRTYYRNTFPAKRQGNDFINEHFIGSYNKDKVEGFFAFINGDKKNDEIGSFLKSFLDMAKDTQAIYEFLQNAVDANSTKFLMFYDEEYLMVINNGEPFSYEGVRSILNVGQSTKANDENTIGKFGIGFKLVHRLVGESSGIEELETGQVGPIVFSWYEGTNAISDLIKVNTSEDLEPAKLITEEVYRPIEGTKKRKHECLTNSPWLFKILLTSFPCQPNDYGVHDINYNETKEDVDLLFKDQEIVNMIDYFKQWVRDKKIIQALNSTSGSLFFLKLGKGKYKLLEDNDLEKGVQISLSILNELTKKNKSANKELKDVIINDKDEIKALDLEFETFTICPDDDNDYLKIYPQGKSDKNKVDIELLFGFCKDYKDATNIIEKYANFYLFFPLSQEAHKFNFIIHCNAFHNGSQRTNLHVKGEDGRNEILFKRFTKELISRLDNYKNQEVVVERFYEIYIALLLSKEPKEERNKWLNKPLYQPLKEYLQQNIPTKDGFSSVSNQVVIKQTLLPISSPNSFGCENFEWFKWEDKDDEKVAKEARDGKGALRLKNWSIKELIINTTNIEAINNWLLGLDNDYKLFLSELNDAIVNFKETEEDEEQKFKENLLKIKLPFENGFHSIAEINDTENNLFLLDNDTIGIQEQLKKLSFKLSSFNLSEYSNLDNFYRKHIECLADSKLLFEKVNIKTSNEYLNKELSAKDKEVIIKSFSKKLNKEERSKLSLFKNKSEIKPSIQLIKNNNAISWLDKFKIQDGYEAITNDLDFTESSNIYHEFIFKLWSEIIAHPDIQVDIDNFYNEVSKYYIHETHHYYRLKEGRELSFIFGTNNKFNKVTEIFYRSELLKAKDYYTAITSAIQKLTDKPIPNQNILSYISKSTSAFYVENVEAEKEILFTSLSEEKIANLQPAERFAVYELAKQLDKEKAEQIKLFYDSNEIPNPKSSKDLLKPDKNRPFYMKAFEIHQDFKQYINKLSFMPNTLVYDKIILTNWENITESLKNTEPTNKEVSLFYKHITNLFINKDSKTLIAVGKAFIYTDNQGFELREAVFFNKKTSLAQAEDVIRKLIDKDFPIYEIMDFLFADSTSPFAIPTEDSITKDNKLKTNILLSKSEVENLLDFCLKNGKERIFDIAYFKYQSSNNKYYFHLDDSNPQFYVNRMEEFKKYVDDYYAEDFHLLEKTFKPEYYQLRLLDLSEIIGRILENLKIIKGQHNKLEVIYDFIDVIRKDSIDIDLKEKYVNLIERLDFDSEDKYSRNSFEYKFLKLELSVIRKKSKDKRSSKEDINTDSLIQNLRAKVYIDEKPLVSLKVLKKFKLNLNEQFSIEISPTDIIPILDNSKLIETISDQFKNEQGNDDKELKENIFIEVDKDETSTFFDFKKSENKAIDTFEKFIFISYKEKKSLNTIEDYTIESLNSIDILKSFYKNIFRPNFKSTKEQDNNKLPPWFKNYFGYNKENYVFHRFAIQEEFLPSNLESWAKINQEERKVKESFLFNLGVNTTKSNIITFRDRLDRNNKRNTTQYNTIKGALQNDKELLNNTLVWYANRVNGQKLNRQKNNTSLDILKDIYENIPFDTQTILPWITEVSDANISIELNQYSTETKPTVFYNLKSEDKKRWQIIFEILHSKGHILINDELLPNVDFIENSRKIEPSSTIDKIKLQEAKIWNSEYYNLWKSNDDSNPTIKTYIDRIPYVDTFLNEVIGNSTNDENNEDGYFDTENNIIYISEKCQNFEEKLKELLGLERYNDLEVFKNIQALRSYLENPSEDEKEFSLFNLSGNNELVKKYIFEWLFENNVEFGKDDNRLTLVHKFYAYQNFSDDLPLIFLKVESAKSIYYLDTWNNKKVYSFQADSDADLQKAYSIIFENERQMINKHYWNSNYISQSEELKLDDVVDVETLRSNNFREKWSINQYESWIYKDEVKVYIVEKGIPYKDYFFDNKTIFNKTYIKDENKYWCKEENELYLKKDAYETDEDIINTIFHHTDGSKWNKLINALEGGIVNSEIATLINENKITKNELQKWIDRKNKHGGDNSNGSPSFEENHAIGNEGEEFIYNLLSKPNKYNLTIKYWFNEDFVMRYGTETVKDEKKHYDMIAIDKDGNECYIECKSTPLTKALFYMSAEEWKTYFDIKKTEGKRYILFRVFNLRRTKDCLTYDDLITAIEDNRLIPYSKKDERKLEKNTIYLSVKEHM
jgi:hypothetical protein